jgi:hypothetical protein
MIARFQVLIPFRVLVEADLSQHVNPEEIVIGDFKALIYPPHHSKLEVGDVSGESETAPNEVPKRLDPADPQPPLPGAEIGGNPVIVGDVLRIDFVRDQFDRSVGSNDWNMLVNMGFNLANSWLRRFRTLNRIAWAKPLTAEGVPWEVAILNDDGTTVEKEEHKWRQLLGSNRTIRYTGLDSLIWSAITSLPTNYEPQPSDELLLDAYALLPQVGPAIVLAYSAIETRVAQTLDRLAILTGQNPALWSWLTDREDHTKDPSTSDQLDVLAKALTGRSLKDDQQLWEKFRNLNSARNRFVHEGKATIGRSGTVVDASKAAELVQGAELIIDWLESLLPQDERRPRFVSPNPMSFATLLVKVPASEVVSNDSATETEASDEQDEFGPEDSTPME